VEESMIQFDMISLPDLPREEHSALLHCAAMTVHPSIVEGGHAPFPFYESISLGTPCLMATGPHVAELAQQDPAALQFAFDPNDAAGLADLVCATLDSRPATVAKQQAIYDSMRTRTWAAVSAIYAGLACGRLDGSELRQDARPHRIATSA
jgi:glycosyltransferase involved in cell wall biosynthesis